MHLFAFLIYFLLIRTIWPSCLKECSLQFWSLPVITSILQPAARGAGRGILSSCSTNPSLLAHQAPAAHQHCPCSLCRGKNPGCKVTDPPILWECSHMCKILHVPGFLCHPSWLLERQLSCSVWNAFSSPLHKKIFPASPFPVLVFQAKPKLLDVGRSAAWAQCANSSSRIQPGPSHFPALPAQPQISAWAGRCCSSGGKQGELRWGSCDLWALWFVFWGSQSRAGDSLSWFMMECQGREMSSSFPGALSCPLRLLASVVFPSRKLLWITTPWSCRKNQRVPIPGLWQTRSPFLWS